MSLTLDRSAEMIALLLPGTGGTVARDFALLAAALESHVRSDGYDYRSDTGSTYESMVEEVIGRITSEPVGEFLIIGYSLSAAIAVGVAAKIPDRVAGLVLIAGFADGTDPRVVNEFRYWQHLIELNPASFASRVAVIGHHADVEAALGETEIARRVSEYLSIIDLPKTMSQIAIDLEVQLGRVPATIAAPVLVIGCEGDRIVPEPVTRELAGQFPNSQYEVIDAGHFALVEQPERVTQIILDWIAASSSGRSVGASSNLRSDREESTHMKHLARHPLTESGSLDGGRTS
ncbi:alpha/beta fold hydrolase [Leucobacter sp. L43]|uniref:alpha/beta fold hydrolase n=1 Tax=Leucobacter sp. L43 TaxID=2798040 RepID=UPI001904547F|nr:alpha/beta hydrolase [Leucobacter sp. L43]